MRFKDKAALVIGGSQGIGEAIAADFAKEGARVALVASSSLEKAEAAARRIAPDSRARGYVADVRDAEAVGGLVQDVARDFGRIDILLNCAGVFYPTPVGRTKFDDFSRMVDINLKGTWNTINAAVPIMRAQRYGKIVNIASVCGVMGFGSFAVYCATKAAIIMLTKSLALELAPHNINVNAIGPGNTATPINEYVRTDPAYKKVLESIVAGTPSGQAYSSVSDISQLALFLASDAARAMHGSFVLADEGYSAGVDFSAQS